MREAEAWELLRRHDSAEGVEWPPGYDWEAAERRFRALVARLEDALEMPLQAESGATIQDASFHGQVVLPDALLGPTRRPGVTYALRVSNFGGLAAICGDDEVEPRALAAVDEALEAAGYVRLPGALLDRPYDGRVPAGIATWWDRYFDWL